MRVKPLKSDIPAPVTTWQEQPIVTGLDRIAVYNSYRIHRWTWPNLPGELAILLFAAFDNQQANRTQPSLLETDSYTGEDSVEGYGTTEYTDVTITEMSSRERGLPHYQGLSMSFEVYIA